MLNSNSEYSTTGTMAVYIPRNKNAPKIIKPGLDYFLIKIHSAQAAFTGNFLESVKNLVVTSQVEINHPAFGEDSLQCIQRTREVKRNRAEQLGLNTNFVDLVPAIMTKISFSIEFILDKENRLAQLSGLINDDSFLSVISLAPGAAMVAKTIAGLAQKIINTFIPTTSKEPILQFGGAFNLASEELKDGYFVVLGTRDEKNPLPRPLPTFTVESGQLMGDGKPITQLSYVVFDIQQCPVRTRALNENALWNLKLREAEDEASNAQWGTDEEKSQAWGKCQKLVREAQTLIRAVINYLAVESEAIIKKSFKKCADSLGVKQNNSRVVKVSTQSWQPADVWQDLMALGVSPDEDLSVTVENYDYSVSQSEVILASNNLL